MSVIVRVHIIKLYAEINVNLFRSKEFEMRFSKVFIKKNLPAFTYLLIYYMAFRIGYNISDYDYRNTEVSLSLLRHV